MENLYSLKTQNTKTKGHPIRVAFFLYLYITPTHFFYIIYMKVIIPETLNDIKLHQYQKWLKVSDQNEDQNFLKQKMIEIFCDIPLRDVLNIRTSDVDQIVDDINNVFQQKPKFIDRFDYDGKRFGFIPKLDDISFGEYVDLDNYLPEWDMMGKAMCVLFRPVTYENKNNYLIEQYDGADKYDMRNMTLDIVFGALGFFLSFKDRIIEYYPELFGAKHGRQIATSDQGFSEKWGWYQSVYGLAQGDVRRFDEITKLKLHTCLQYLAFEKDKVDLQEKMFKTKK